MDIQTYDRYKDALDTVGSTGDKDALDKIKAKLISEYGANDDDVDTLLKYHT